MKIERWKKKDNKNLKTAFIPGIKTKVFRFLELLNFPMTDYCQFTFTFRFKSYSEVINLAYFILHISIYMYLAVGTKKLEQR